jgi:hypothetical protein
MAPGEDCRLKHAKSGRWWELGIELLLTFKGLQQGGRVIIATDPRLTDSELRSRV